MSRADDPSYMAFLRDFVAELHHPERLTWELEAHLADALINAPRSIEPGQCGRWRVNPAFVPELSAMGLCGPSGHVTAFGAAVRIELIAGEVDLAA